MGWEVLLSDMEIRAERMRTEIEEEGIVMKPMLGSIFWDFPFMRLRFSFWKKLRPSE